VVCCGGAKLIVVGLFGDTSGVCGLPTGASGFIADAGLDEEPAAGSFGAAGFEDATPPMAYFRKPR